ncbi:hypothetical protein [Micromonospora sp. CPCC 206061]|uniref:hypothetical protein n=1 Tax=Micromonospora sp. CPCC 206061 TaxID=3122410 RepID=UPI002FF1918F
MRYRRHATKPTMALWALIAAGDAALLVSGVSVAVMLFVLAVAAVVALGVVAAAWMVLRRPEPQPVRHGPQRRLAR